MTMTKKDREAAERDFASRDRKKRDLADSAAAESAKSERVESACASLVCAEKEIRDLIARADPKMEIGRVAADALEQTIRTKGRLRAALKQGLSLIHI